MNTSCIGNNRLQEIAASRQPTVDEQGHLNNCGNCKEKLITFRKTIEAGSE